MFVGLERRRLYRRFHAPAQACVSHKALSGEALTWDNKAAVGMNITPLNPLALILLQKKSCRLATGRETRLIKHQVSVVVHKICLSQRLVREDGVQKEPVL